MSTESHGIQQAVAEFIRDRHLLGAFVTWLLRDAHAAADVICDPGGVGDFTHEAVVAQVRTAENPVKREGMWPKQIK